MNKFRVGNVVRHDFSPEQGTVTELRDDEYSVYVKWDSVPERNDWYKPEVLVMVRGAGGGSMTLGDIKLTREPLGQDITSEGDNVPPAAENPSEGSYEAHSSK